MRTSTCGLGDPAILSEVCNRHASADLDVMEMAARLAGSLYIPIDVAVEILAAVGWLMLEREARG